MKSLVIAAMVLTPAVAHAGVQFAGAHAAYSIGGAVVNGPGDGARSALDLGAAFGWFSHEKAKYLPEEKGPTGGVSLVTGFGTSPTLFALELGYASDVQISGLSVCIGPVLQVDPSTHAGGTFRATFDFAFAQVGLRLDVVGRENPELSLAATIGVGPF
ncbi:MAG TPA: hypothetical protein VGM39_12760 [Kofleriaceae bacterium]